MTNTCEPSGLDSEISEFLSRVAANDGVPALSDGVLDSLKEPQDSAAHAPIGVKLLSDGQLAGYGAIADQGERSALEFCVAPDFRGRGRGRLLASDLIARAKDLGIVERTWAWAHGDSPAAQALADAFGYSRERVLLQLSTDRIHEGFTLPAVEPIDGVTVRTYRAGDEVRWREINNAAFSWHPEQGNQSEADYAKIVNDPQFEPDDVFFAVLDDQIVGFHHTKIHTDHPSGLTVGEVYVIGVDPHVHSRGLGSVLMDAGMRHLVERGVDMIELYVESDNEKALHLYRKLGFVNEIRHVSYAPAQSGQEDA